VRSFGAAVASRRRPEWWETDGPGETRGTLSNAAVNLHPLVCWEASFEEILMDSGWICLYSREVTCQCAGGGTVNCDDG
jgi:hypothetical protein